MRLWSTAPNPRRRAISRARWRETTMSSSRRMAIRSIRSSSTISTTPHGIASEQAPKQEAASDGIERGVNTLELEAKLDQRDRHGRLDADDDRLSTHQPGVDREIVEEPTQERVDRLDHRQIEDHPAHAGTLQHRAERLLQGQGVAVGQIRQDRG